MLDAVAVELLERVFERLPTARDVRSWAGTSRALRAVDAEAHARARWLLRKHAARALLDAGSDAAVVTQLLQLDGGLAGGGGVNVATAALGPVQDVAGSTALHLAAATGADDTVAVLLTAPGIEPGRRDARGRTPLHWAAAGGHRRCVRALLAHPEVDASTPDAQDDTALHLAARAGHTGCVKLGARIWRRPSSPRQWGTTSGASKRCYAPGPTPGSWMPGTRPRCTPLWAPKSGARSASRRWPGPALTWTSVAAAGPPRS